MQIIKIRLQTIETDLKSIRQSREGVVGNFTHIIKTVKTGESVEIDNGFTVYYAAAEPRVIEKKKKMKLEDDAVDRMR